jgi:hypothetical protein
MFEYGESATGFVPLEFPFDEEDPLSPQPERTAVATSASAERTARGRIRFALIIGKV